MSLQSVLDFVNGAVAGFAFVMTGQPFEYIIFLCLVQSKLGFK